MLCAALIVSAVLRSAPSPAPAEPPLPPAAVLVEGVAASPAAAPVAALREIWCRVVGRNFSILEGRYAELGEGSAPPPLDTQRKRLVEVKELSNGLYRAVLEVEAPPALMRAQEKMREMTTKGEAQIASSGSVLAARELARENALEKAALAAVAEVYPASSVPGFLEGRVVYLETLREGVEEGSYRLTARVRVELATP